METIEIPRSEYDELKAKAAQVGDLETRVSELEPQAAKVPDLEKKVEAEESAKVAAEKERDDLKTKVDEAEESARAADLAKDRLGKLGKGFTEKLGDFTRGRLEEQAGSLSDEDWDSRLKELEETAGVKRDEGGAPSGEEQRNGESFSREETARSNLGNGNGNGGTGQDPSAAKRRSVVAGLVRK